MAEKTGSIHVFNLPSATGIKAITAHHISNEFRRHIHRTVIIGLVDQGRRHIIHQHGMTHISENEMFVLNPGQVHSCCCDGSSRHSYRVLSVSYQTLQSISRQVYKRDAPSLYFNDIELKSTRLVEKFKCVFKRIENREPAAKTEIILCSFLSQLVRLVSKKRSATDSKCVQKDSIQRVCRYIQTHYADPLSLEKMAGIACLSPFHFQREFKRILGITPCEYISDFRIHQSEKMLLKSESLVDIAGRTGFVDQSHFSKVFKKTMGIPPGKFSRINAVTNADSIY